MKLFVSRYLLVWVAIGSLLLLPGVASGFEQPGNARVFTQSVGGTIPGHYIVVLRRDAHAPSVAAIAGIAPRYIYTKALNGFAGVLTAKQLTALQRHPDIIYIEQDEEVHLATSQANATWGLDRIDQHLGPLDATYSYTSTGAGVAAFIIDTGIRFDHSEFGNRALSGFDAIDGGRADDCNGHGTHVAGTVGGATYGVAKAVTLVAVRVLNCIGSGSTSGVIAGIDWVTNVHQPGTPAVANMSLGGGTSTALDTAVRNSIGDGVSYSVAAGNGNLLGRAQDACNYSPARVREAFTIGATDNTDTKAAWSNYGSCVDGFAPGVNITSAWHTGGTATNTISGTSMASPHVAGAVALYLQTNPAATVQDVGRSLASIATKGIVKLSNTPNNHLLFVNF